MCKNIYRRNSNELLVHCIYTHRSSASTLASLRHTMSTQQENLSVVTGETSEPLWTTTLGSLIEMQARRYGDRTAVVFPWQRVSMTYRDLLFRSKIVAKALLAAGLVHGDSIAITAGNSYQYIEVFLGAARIGCPVVVLNSTYTPSELLRAVTFSGM